GAWVLAQTTIRFPPDSIHVAVIDPGVGTIRKIVYAAIDGRRYVAPDNGLLGLLACRKTPTVVREISDRDYWREEVSSTFHGRDIMAPVAAHIARGIDPADLGEPLTGLAPLDWPAPVIAEGRVEAEVCVIDAFGNLITNVEADVVANLGCGNDLEIFIGGKQIRGLSNTYGDAAPGQLIALIGSHGHLEIAQVCGSARAALSAEVGDRVVLTVR
ncbi:MAG: SAM-dependent chlorinase/fluorinase, partial [Planctomycetes bacterium]|nr:SAM-dependent chlorinase/fluorinase [Planctomycetota bacterium]